tara:strand:+ start:506 stop:844 length:339 start_codon:yes stop_codon:yes gene_type:complete
MAQKAYIVIAHSFRPAEGQNTSMKNFGKEGKWTMVEDVYFVTRLRKRYWDHSTTIINLSDAKIEKNTAETTDYNKIVQHVMIKYPQHYNKFVQECKESGLINKGEKKLEANG